MAYFKVCGTVVDGSTDKTAKRKLGLGSRCVGSDFNMRLTEKEETWPH